MLELEDYINEKNQIYLVYLTETKLNKVTDLTNTGKGNYTIWKKDKEI